MRFRMLGWLSVLSLVGLLGIILHRPTLVPLFVFLAFLDFFRADERAEANLGRAAVIAFTVTLVAFVVTAILFGVAVDQQGKGQWSLGDVVTLLEFAFGTTFLLCLGSFIISYIYFDMRGSCRR